MEKRICVDCGEEVTSEEALLSAIFGEDFRCKKCFDLKRFPKCAKCHVSTTAGLYFEGKPYCPHHLPYA